MESFFTQEFEEYISPSCDRATFIQTYLEKRGVSTNRLVIDGKNHILVQFDKRFYNPQFKIKTVVAHHDRVPNSPGANDNSAADWLLMNWAVALSSYPEFHNVRLIFTDGEELGWNTGVKEQGAYAIANTFRRLGIVNDDVYVFDACGRGEIPILSRTVIPQGASKDFAQRFASLFDRTQELLRSASPERWMSLPVPYSDNASFLACSIPAVAITMLPAQEASLYARTIINDKKLEASVLNRESSKKERMASDAPEYSYKERLPTTWRLFHSPSDNISSLTDQSIPVMESILAALARQKTIA